MPDHSTLNLEELLKYPQVEKATGDINAELSRRVGPVRGSPGRWSRQQHPVHCTATTGRQVARAGLPITRIGAGWDIDFLLRIGQRCFAAIHRRVE